MRDIILILLLIIWFSNFILLTFYLLISFSSFAKLLSKLSINKKQILLKYKLFYLLIDGNNNAVNDIFSKEDFEIYNNKKLQKNRKLKLKNLNHYENI